MDPEVFAQYELPSLYVHLHFYLVALDPGGGFRPKFLGAWPLPFSPFPSSYLPLFSCPLPSPFLPAFRSRHP